MDELEKFHEEGTKYTRRSFTPEYSRAREWLKKEMELSGLNAYVDEAGNLIGRREGTDNSLPPIIIGSHIDTVMCGGKYDGIVGVMAGIEIASSLKDGNISLNHPFEVIDFLAEEPSSFGISTIGSRGKSGCLSNRQLNFKDEDGRLLKDMIKELGGKPDKLNKPLHIYGDIKAFMELHIEQGPVLEDENIDIGIVTGISGISRHRVKITGKKGHAGTIPMDRRKDALVAASKMVDFLNKTVLQEGKRENSLVGTVGKFEVLPNYANVIPGNVTFEFEIRCTDETVLSSVISKLRNDFESINLASNTFFEFMNISKVDSVSTNKTLMKKIEKSSKSFNYTYKYIPSGAGHDTSYMALIAPVGMVFIPCKDGVSHSPEEYTSIEQIMKGTHVLYNTLLSIDSDV